MSKGLILLLSIFIVSCSSGNKPVAKVAPKEFSPGEVILASQLLQKVYDQEMAALECVPDTEEAGLLLRTIRPRMEVVQDDIEVKLDSAQEIDKLIKSCEKNCTCNFLDDLFKEHQVTLTKAQKALFTATKVEKEANRCLSYIQTTFCKGELYHELNKEKEDFSFD